MSDSPTIPWQTRSDLKVIELGGEREEVYAIKDVVSNEFFRFGEVEFQLLELLRKSITLDGLKQAMRDRFGFTLETREITTYLNHLAADNLLVATKFGDGTRLFRQHERLHSGGMLQQFMGLMSIKLPGIYPGPLLSALQPVGALLFNPVSVVLATVAFLVTMMFAFLSWQTLGERVPAVAELISVEHLVMMAVGFAIAKIFHEIGHGLACRQMGYECSEMGVLLLVMIPCLYCDVSDLWTAKSRYKKMLVSLAGVFVELSLATVCFWGWYFSLDGPLSRFLFGMMLVTSVNTVFVNGNPLMKYDGYYALSDWVRVHNLAAAAQNCLIRSVDGFFFGIEPVLTLHQSPRWLKAYAVGSVIYRWMIFSAIGWMAWTFFESQQLLAFGRVVIAGLLILVLLPLLFALRRYWGNTWRYGIRWLNAIAFLLIVGAILWFGCQVEFQHRVSGKATIQLAQANQVFSPDEGIVQAFVSDGEMVDQGDRLAIVTNDDLLLERLVATEQVDDVMARLEALELANNNTTAAEIEFWKKREASWRRKLAGIEQRIEKLSIVAPKKGRFVAHSLSPASREQAEEMLVPQRGNWTCSEHSGGSVDRGENLGYVADPDSFEGTLEISEKEIELVENNQEVRVFLPFKKQFVVGKVTYISAESENEGKSAESGDVTGKSPEGFFRVEFQFPFDDRVRIGSSRKAVILCGKTNGFQWAKRWIYSTFWL